MQVVTPKEDPNKYCRKPVKRHQPYHESDHVLNIAYNILVSGKKLEHLELLRNYEVYLNALGAVRIPDPTTAGDFCRRFREADIMDLMDVINRTRKRVWAEQPPEFFDLAIVDADGTLVETDVECKRGIDIAYDGTWGYHPLLISLANTAEPLFLVNRSGNRPSQEQADVFLDKAVDLCRSAGFRRILLRGDTKFTQTKHLDRWDRAGDVRFVFGYEAHESLKALAEDLPAGAYSFLERAPRYEIQTVPRQQPERVKPEIVKRRGFETIHVLEEMIAEFNYGVLQTFLWVRIGVQIIRKEATADARHRFVLQAAGSRKALEGNSCFSGSRGETSRCMARSFTQRDFLLS